MDTEPSATLIPDIEEVRRLAPSGEVTTVAVLLMVAVTLWRMVGAMLRRAEVQQQKREDASAEMQARLIGITTAAIDRLSISVHAVELAVVKSDEHNQAALASLRDAGAQAISRLDRHDGLLGDHESRLAVLEHRRTP